MTTVHTILKKAKNPLILLILFSLTACGTLEVDVERTPTPDHAATATVSALATENARLATQVATLAVPTSTPTPSLGKLAYVQGGDIWVKPLPDGEPQRLTTDGRNSAPRWSPSGEWLAFRKGDYQVWLMSADGNSARSLNEGAAVDAFAWAPADDRLAYVAATGLQIISADGAAPVTLVPPSLPDHGPGQMGRITWSPDGAWIAFGWQEQQPKQPLTYQGLWRVSSDGEQLAELYASGVPEKGEAILAGWSLDGQRIFFWQGDILSASILADGVPLYSLPAGGGEPAKLVDTVLVHDDFLALAPQGDRLAVTAGGYRATWTNKRVAVVGTGDGELAWLTDESVVAFSPAWSPDSTRLAYVAMPDEGDLVGGDDARLGMMERRVWAVNVQGEPQSQQLTDDPAYRDERPLWSADGSHLLFARMDAEGRASLWLMRADGNEQHQVVDELTSSPGQFGYYGYTEWDQLFDWWRGPVRVPEGVAVPTPGPPPTARPPASPTLTPPLPTPTIGPSVSPTPTPSPPTPSPTAVLTATRTYTDTALGFAIDYPADWDTDGVQGEFVWLSNPATSGEERQAINIAALAGESLEAMLDNVEGSSFGPYLIMAEPVQLGGLEALKVTLRQAPEGLSLLWLVITPQSRQQGQGLTIAAYGDPALVEAIVATWRPIEKLYVVELTPVAGETPAPTGPEGQLALLIGGPPVSLVDLAGGPPRTLGADNMPTYSSLYFQWSPDGREIVYAADTDLWLLDVESGESQNLTDNDRWDLMPAWSPDGDWIAFTSRPLLPDESKTGWGKGAWGGALAVIGANGDDFRILDDEGNVMATPSWAPTGRRLAYAADGELRLYDLDADERTVLDPLDFDLADVAYLGGPAWSPNGRFIAAYFSRSAALADWDALGASTAPDVGQGVVVFDLEARTAEVLFKWEAPFVGATSMLRWQPGGDLLLIDVRAAPRVPQQAGLWLADPPSGEVTALPVAAYDADWSPDGRWIAAIDLDDRERLVLMDIKQPTAEPIVRRWPYGLEGLAWRPTFDQ